MELVEGSGLRGGLANHAHYTEQVAARFVKQMCMGLHYLHNHGTYPPTYIHNMHLQLLTYCYLLSIKDYTNTRETNVYSPLLIPCRISQAWCTVISKSITYY